ncbi:hypothetical protein AB1Y20_005192 [Prymnesium parvum]|uniref:RNA methyltransferase n=1 Tax=Prymnesium parvum TaxID=97485 RepID=A0AB34J5W3_PRYPA
MDSKAAPPLPKRQKKLRLAQRVGLNRAPVAHEMQPCSAHPPAPAPALAATDKVKADCTASSVASVAEAAASCAPASRAAATQGATAAAPQVGRPWTVSVALPGSIVDNAQTQELRSYLVGQVARACAIFNVDEIVLFETEASRRVASDDHKGRTSGCVFTARLLQYLECPQYLRKQCFPHHPDLRSVGLIPPLDAPHHLRVDESCAYREAVVVERANAKAGSCFVYTGLPKELKLNVEVPVGTRLTLQMPRVGGKGTAKAVAPREPREEAGLYWGYQVRIAPSLSAVWSECPYQGGYDCSIGTSEHGSNALSDGSFRLPNFAHLLVVFGGVEGLEPVVAADDSLAECEDDVACLFDHYLNLCPSQGSRTIRTEEALLVGMATLRPFIEKAHAHSA